MESIIVHPKNPMELSALKSALKEMGIKYEKFHGRNTQKSPFSDKKTSGNKTEKSTKNFNAKPKTDL